MVLVYIKWEFVLNKDIYIGYNDITI